MRFEQTIPPLLLAPLGAVAVMATVEWGGLSRGYWMVLAYAYGICLLNGAAGVLPVFALVPRLRRPPFWIALPWGAVIAWCATIVWSDSLSRDFVLMGSAGAAAGFVYALAARMWRPDQHD